MRLPLWRRRDFIKDELRGHMWLAAEERTESGESEQQARLHAMRELGNDLAIREATSETWGWMPIERFWLDIRFGARLMRKNPVFTLTAVLTLAIGISASAAVFSFVNTLLLRPLFPGIDRLLVLQDVPRSSSSMDMGDTKMTNKVSYPEFLAWRSHHELFDSVAAQYQQMVTLTGEDEPRRLVASFVSYEYLPTLGVNPLIGRGFHQEDEPRGAAPVVLLANHFWRSRFHRDPSVIGKRLTLNGESYTIIGVLPPGVSLGQEPDIVAPLRVNPASAPATYNFLVAIARMKPGASVGSAVAAAGTQGKLLENAFGKSADVIAIPLQQYVLGKTRPFLLLLVAGVGAVFLIACANIANLTLARGTAREKEIAVRVAVGASHMRLLRQLLTENLLLGLFGSVLAFLLLKFASTPLTTLLSDRLPPGATLQVDNQAIAFMVLLAVITALVVGIAPAVQGTRRDVREGLALGGRSHSSGSHSLRSALVVAEFALSLMLLAAAGLLLRSFNRLLNVDKGFEPGHVLTMQIALTSGRYKTDAAALQYVTEVARRVESLPAVESAGFSSNIPFSGNSISGDFGIEGRPIDPGEQIIGSKQVVTSGYFAAMHIPVIRGRGFSGRDSADSPCVVAVDQLFAKRYFGNIDPLGKRVTFGWAGDEPCEVVGIVGAIREFSLTAQASPTVYAPLAQRAAVLEDFPLGLAVRTKQDPLDLSRAIRDEIHRLDGSQVIDQLKTMNDVVNDSVSSRRAPLWLFGGFAVIAVLLSAIGIYGVMSYYVSQRRREIGTRLALGAQRADILRLVLGRVAQLVLTGVALGAALAYATSRSLAGLLYATQPHDPLTFAAVATLLCTIAVIASAAPVFRATSIDPQVALRSE